MQEYRASLLRCLPRLSHLCLSLLLAVPPQQFAIDLGDFFQVVFQLMVVLNPTPHLVEMFAGDDTARRAASSQGDGEVPHWAMPLTARALAGRVTAGHVAFDQRTTQDVGHRRQQLSQPLPTLTQGELGKST